MTSRDRNINPGRRRRSACGQRERWPDRMGTPPLRRPLADQKDAETENRIVLPAMDEPFFDDEKFGWI